MACYYLGMVAARLCRVVATSLFPPLRTRTLEDRKLKRDLELFFFFSKAIFCRVDGFDSSVTHIRDKEGEAWKSIYNISIRMGMKQEVKPGRGYSCEWTNEEMMEILTWLSSAE